MSKAFPNTGATVIDSVADLPAASADLEGVMVFQKDTNELKICDGSGWVSVVDTDAPPGLELISPTSVTNATNTNGLITFSGVGEVMLDGLFSSKYVFYRMLFNMFTTNGTNTDINLRLRANGVSNSGTSYYRQTLNVDNGTVSASRSLGTYAGFTWVSNNASRGFCAMDIMDPATASPTFFIPLSINGYLGAYSSWYSIQHNVSTSYDGFHFFPGAGLSVSGSVRVYGYRNSI